MEQLSVLNHPFDKKYKTIVRVAPRLDYMMLVDWLNKNSKGSVDIRFVEGKGMELIVGFENPDDATFFKIKFMI